MEYQIVWSDWGMLPLAAQQIRTKVFIQEQGFVEEFDEYDEQSWHALLYLEEMPVGTARLFWDNAPETMRLGRLAFLPEARMGGWGRRLLQCCCEKAARKGAQRVVLDAQVRVQGFYAACGFCSVGQPFDEEGCPHILMEYRLREEGSC